MNRKICVVTGSRSEYGLLRWVMEGIQDDPALTLQIVATGMHLSPEFGNSHNVIEGDGFHIDWKVEMLVSSDTPVGIAKSMGLGLIGFADAFSTLAPDLVLVLGDRFEIFSVVSAALVARIPVAHLHGGETTEGAFDEAIRHSITKMSHLHFVAAQAYRERVIQLGEDPSSIHLVGGLGIDSIKRMRLLNREELEASIDFKFGKKNLLVTFHPVTLDSVPPETQMVELLAALGTVKDTKLIFTLPNADTGGRNIMRMIEKFVAQRENACVFGSLGQLRYLSCIAAVDGVVGNSSSGLIEVPSFKKATINIGDRQRGRLQADSVINCDAERGSILSSVNRLYTREFQEVVSRTDNPYGDGGASEAILSVLRAVSLDGLVKKKFYDQTDVI